MAGASAAAKLTVSVLAAAFLAVVLWGASPVAAKIAVAGLPPVAVACLRTLIGGLAALVIALMMRLPLPSTPGQRGTLAISGLGGFIAFPLLFTLGVAATSANRASIILAALPVLTGAYAHALERRLPAPMWWIGCTIALLGEVLLILWRQPAAAAAHSVATLGGDLLVVASTLFAAMGYVAGGRLKQQGYSATATTFWGAAGSAILLLPSVPWLMGLGLEAASVEAWAGVLYLAIAVTIIGYILWYWALGQGGIARVGLMQFLQPISGLLLAAVLLGEQLTLPLAVAAVLVLAGVFIAARAG